MRSSLILYVCRRLVRSVLAFGPLTTLLFIGVSKPIAAETLLTFCYDPYPPYAIGSEGEAQGGSKVTLLAAVVDRIDGVTAEAVIMPWKRCQAQAKAGEVDGILPLFQSPERATYLTFTRGTFQQTSGFWYSADRFPDPLEWNGEFGELSSLRLGMVSGSIIDERMEAAWENRDGITRARDVKTLMQLLLRDRVDVVAVDDAVARYTLQLNGWQDRLVPVERPISTRVSFFGLSKASGAEEYLIAFNEILDEMETTGALEQIYLNGE